TSCTSRGSVRATAAWSSPSRKLFGTPSGRRHLHQEGRRSPLRSPYSLLMVVILSGVAGSGKTTVGTRLAEALRWDFLDADALHPPESVAKMRAGVALEESDRLP